MRRREALLALLTTCIIGVHGHALAQAPDKPHRIGFLSGYSAAGAADIRGILVDSLRELGYREGKNIVFIDRYANGELQRLPALARELVQARVDVIATQTTPAAVAAKAADSRMPVVNITSGDAIGSGLVANLARPGGNVTGLSFLGVELAVKQMELLREIAPAIRRVGLLANPGIPPERNFFREMERAAPAMNLHVTFIEAKTSMDYAAAFTAIGRERVDGLVVAPSISNHDAWRNVVELAAKHRLPAIYPFREFAVAGGLVAYGFNRREFYSRAGSYVDKILKGAKPADLPLEQPSRFELIINLTRAQELGLTVPQDLLLRAQDVFR